MAPILVHRRKGRDHRQQETWDNNQQKILTTIRKVESGDFGRPYATVSEIHKEINKKDKMSLRTVHSHLQSLLKKDSISKVGRGHYSSFHAQIVKDLYIGFLREQMKEIPQLEDQELHELAALKFTRELWGRKGIDTIRYVEKERKKEILEFLHMIQKSTIIRVFSKEKMDDLGSEYVRKTISQSVAEFLIRFIRHEHFKKIPEEAWYDISKDVSKELELVEKLGEVKKDKKLLEDCSVRIVIDFDPTKLG